LFILNYKHKCTRTAVACTCSSSNCRYNTHSPRS
jgi:hypothetical protein